MESGGEWIFGEGDGLEFGWVEADWAMSCACGGGCVRGAVFEGKEVGHKNGFLERLWNGGERAAENFWA